MKEIKNDAFYNLVKQYDSDTEHHLVGEVDYYLLDDNKPYEGLRSHREALIFERDGAATTLIRWSHGPVI